MNNKCPGIKHAFKVSIDEDHFVKFYVFDDKENMLAACPGEGEFLAKCHTTWFAEVETKLDRKAGPKFGDILLFEERISVGILAHEIQHLLNGWMEFKELATDKDDELLASIAERLHEEFWNEYYVRYPQHA